MSRDRQQSPKYEADTQNAHDVDFDAEHRPDIARRASTAELRRAAAAIQRANTGTGPSTVAVREAAAVGLASPTTALPHAAQIQRSLGPDHDISQIQAHVGGTAAHAMGATAFASGNHVVFDRPPDLHTAAHEVAHVVQQARGVNLDGGVGEAGDAYERHADAVADRVVAGQSARDLLGDPAHASSATGAVQRKPVSDASPPQQQAQHEKADDADFKGLQSAIALLAKHLDLTAREMQRAMNTNADTDAGASPQIQWLDECVKNAASELYRLSTHIGSVAKTESGLTTQYNLLHHEVGELNEAWQTFQVTYQQAAQFAKSHGEPLAAKITFMADEMATIWTSLQKPGGDLESTFHEVDGRQETKMFDEALQTNVSAVCDAARSVRMGLATGAPAVEQGDLSKVIRHAAEVADLLMRTSNTKAVTAHKAQLKNMIAELHSLEAESASNAVISGQLKSSELYRNAMATIEAKAGR